MALLLGLLIGFWIGWIILALIANSIKVINHPPHADTPLRMGRKIQPKKRDRYENE